MPHCGGGHRRIKLSYRLGSSSLLVVSLHPRPDQARQRDQQDRLHRSGGVCSRSCTPPRTTTRTIVGYEALVFRSCRAGLDVAFDPVTAPVHRPEVFELGEALARAGRPDFGTTHLLSDALDQLPTDDPDVVTRAMMDAGTDTAPAAYVRNGAGGLGATHLPRAAGPRAARPGPPPHAACARRHRTRLVRLPRRPHPRAVDTTRASRSRQLAAVHGPSRPGPLVVHDDDRHVRRHAHTTRRRRLESSRPSTAAHRRTALAAGQAPHTRAPAVLALSYDRAGPRAVALSPARATARPAVVRCTPVTS